MTKDELIERLRNFDSVFDSDKILDEAADALEAADKRIAEEREQHDIMMERGAEKLAEAERKLAVAREALKKAEHTHGCRARRCKGGDEWIDETTCDCCISEALAQIGGDDDHKE